MTFREFSVPEVCEQILFVKIQTFRNKLEKYIKQLEESYYVEIRKKRPMIIALAPKQQAVKQQIADDEFLKILNCEIGRKDIELLKFLLKTILEKKIVPVQDEFVNLGLHENIVTAENRTKVKNYLAFLRENRIIIPPLETPVWIYNPDVLPEYDEETGEIFPTYHKKHVRWVYYDYGTDGVVANRERLSEMTQKAFHEAFKVAWSEAYQRYINPMKKSNLPSAFIAEETQKLKRNVMRSLGKAYGIHCCERVEEPIINPKVAVCLKQYFGINAAKPNREIKIDVSNVPYVEIDRPIGQAMSKLEEYTEYQKLIKSRAKVYKEGKYALPFHLYEKWHGEDEFANALIPRQQVIELEDDIPNDSFEHHNRANEVAIANNETTIINENDNGFEQQLNAFIMKGTDATAEDAMTLLSGMVNKPKQQKEKELPW